MAPICGAELNACLHSCVVDEQNFEQLPGVNYVGAAYLIVAVQTTP